MGQFDQFANQGGAAAWDPDEAAKAKLIAEEQLRTADYAGDLPEPLGSDQDVTEPDAGETDEADPDTAVFTDPDGAPGA